MVMNEYKILAVIPARSGSKGLKDKNIIPLNGKPLMAYTIEAALDSGLFDTIHVSTDSEKYSEIATQCGADQPFLRAVQNAGDKSSSWDAAREVIRRYAEAGKQFDICILLQPTSPLRDAGDIEKAYSLFLEKHAKTVVSVTEAVQPIQWCFPLEEDLSMKEYVQSPYKNARRQDLEKNYRENGAIYIVWVDDIMDPSYDLYNMECYAYIMRPKKSIDIDSMTDLRIAEVLMRENEER